MAFTNIGCISVSSVFATQLWQAGAKSIGPVVLPDKFSGGMLLVDLTQLADLTCNIVVAMELSLDNGVTWQSLGGWGVNVPTSGYHFNASVLVDANNDPIRVTGNYLRLIEPINAVRQVRAVATLSKPAVIGMSIVIW